MSVKNSNIHIYVYIYNPCVQGDSLACACLALFASSGMRPQRMHDHGMDQGHFGYNGVQIFAIPHHYIMMNEKINDWWWELFPLLRSPTTKQISRIKMCVYIFIFIRALSAYQKCLIEREKIWFRFRLFVYILLFYYYQGKIKSSRFRFDDKLGSQRKQAYAIRTTKWTLLHSNRAEYRSKNDCIRTESQHRRNIDGEKLAIMDIFSYE